jgi:hypothetical protein
MWKDPIVAEVRAAREAYAKRFNYDLDRIGADLRKKEKARAATESRGKPSRAKGKSTSSRNRGTKGRKAA